MPHFELTNNQRKYFGLIPVAANWQKQSLSDTIHIYYEGDKIVKILNYGWGYVEYDTNIDTKKRAIILPKTEKGKEQKLTIPKLLKIKGSGIQFSGSFQGGGIHVYHNKRNLFIIKSYAEEGEIMSYPDIANWVKEYTRKIPNNYFEWLETQLSAKRHSIKIREGDIVAFNIAQGEFGFARILIDVSIQRLNENINIPELQAFHPKSLIVAPYAHFANTLQIDIDELVHKKTLPTLCIFDLDVYRGEMPIIGYRPLSKKDKQIPFPKNLSTSITISYTKTDIERSIATNTKP